MAWLLGNPLARYVPVPFPGHPIASSLAVQLAFLLAMLAATWPPHRCLVFLRILLPAVYVLYFGPVFLIRIAHVTHEADQLSLDRALYSLVNLLTGIVLFVVSFGLILREAGLKPPTPPTSTNVRQVASSTGTEGAKVVPPTDTGVKDVISRLDAIYCSAVVWTTVGFGDIVPVSRKAKIVVMVEALFGYVTLGVLVTVFPALATGISKTYFGTEM